MRFSGSKLRELREAAQLSRDALAELSGLSKGTIKRLENDGAASTTTSTVESLAKALGISPAALFTTEEAA